MIDFVSTHYEIYAPEKGGPTKHMEHMGCHYCRKCHLNLQHEL